MNMKRFWKTVLLAAMITAAGLVSAEDPESSEADPPADRGVFFSREPNTSVSIFYDGETVQITETVRIMHKGPGEHVMLTFSQGNQPGYEPRKAVPASGGDSVSYQIFDSTSSRNVLKDVDSHEASGNRDFLQNSLNHSFPTDNQNWQYRTFSYDIEVPADQITEHSGVYTDTFTISLYTRNNLNNLNNIDLLDTREITVMINLGALIRMALVASGAAPDYDNGDHLVDFGILEAGMSETVDLVVQASSSYSIAAESSNRGYLRHETSTGEVPYTFFFDGSQVNLRQEKQPVSLLSHGSSTGGSDTRYPMEIIIEEFGVQPSGQYQDVLSFTITAK